MTNEKPASPTTTAKGVIEALHSCVCLLETMAESAQARDDHAEWAMMSVMAANCRETLEAALSLPASPTQGELAVKDIADLLRRIRSDRGHGAGWVSLFELDEIDAALSALDRTTLPITEGMVLVPREPSEAMIEASVADHAEKAPYATPYGPNGSMAAQWRAMLASGARSIPDEVSTLKSEVDRLEAVVEKLSREIDDLEQEGCEADDEIRRLSLAAPQGTRT